MSFWDNVTGGVVTAPARPQSTFPQPLPGLPGYAMPQPQQPIVEDPMAAVEEQHRRKAHSSKLTLTCENCYSGNVFKPTPNSMAQCYECGWNPRFEQAAGGVPSSAENGPARPARQLSTANNFNPQQIVGTVIL